MRPRSGSRSWRSFARAWPLSALFDHLVYLLFGFVDFAHRIWRVASVAVAVARRWPPVSEVPAISEVIPEVVLPVVVEEPAPAIVHTTASTVIHHVTTTLIIMVEVATPIVVESIIIVVVLIVKAILVVVIAEVAAAAVVLVVERLKAWLVIGAAIVERPIVESLAVVAAIGTARA